MRPKKILLPPYGKRTIVLTSNSKPNAKVTFSLNSKYHNFVVVDLIFRFCESRCEDDLPDGLSIDYLEDESITHPLIRREFYNNDSVICDDSTL